MALQEHPARGANQNCRRPTSRPPGASVAAKALLNVISDGYRNFRQQALRFNTRHLLNHQIRGAPGTTRKRLSEFSCATPDRMHGPQNFDIVETRNRAAT
jgi:hypothetical protein